MIKFSGVVLLCSMIGMAVSSTVLWDESIPVERKVQMVRDGEHNPVWEFNDWVNSLLLPAAFVQFMTELMNTALAHYFLTYVRNVIGASIFYYVTSGLWHIWIYNIMGKELFEKKGWKLPSNDIIIDQILLAQSAIFMYAMLPVFSEWLVESNYTVAYYYVEEIGGWRNYFIYTAIYLFVVEMGVYWMHRELHDIKWAYKYIHGLHHKYNRADTMSPWCSIAFNPLDGILQASPYVVCLFFIPCHYLSHMVFVLLTAVWATNIHDALEFNTEPIMGSKYHTMHHTHYHCNFGQYTILADWLFGTLRVPSPRKKDLQ